MYEVKKVIRSKSVVVLIILLCICNLAFALLPDAPGPKDDGYADTYRRTLDDIIYNAKINYAYSEDKSSADAMYQIEIERHYSEIIDNDVDTYVSGYDVLISSPIPYISALIAAVYVSFISSYADITGDLTLLTFIEKRRLLSFVKIMLTFASAVSFNVISLMSFGIGVFFRFGYSGAFAHIGAVPDYMRCPYNINVITALLLRCLASISAAVVVSLLTGAIIYLTRKFTYTLLLLTVIFGFDILLSTTSTDVLSFFYNFSITCSVTDSWLLRYSGVFLKVFISRIELILFLLLLFSLLGAAAYCYTVIRYHSIASVKKKMASKQQQSSSHTAYLYEFKRICNVRALFVVFIMLTLDCVFWSYNTNIPNNAWERVYKNHLSTIESMTYDEQMTYTVNEMVAADETVNYAVEAREMLEKDEITAEEYIEAVERAGAAELRGDVLYEVYAQLDSIGALQNEGLDATLVYATGWKKLFSQGPDYILLITLMLVIEPYMTGDNDTGYRSILNASFYGDHSARKKYKRSKYVAAVCVSAAIILLFITAELSFVHFRIGLPAWDKYTRGAGIVTPLISMTFIGALSEYLILATIGAILLMIISNILSTLKCKLPTAVLLVSVYTAILAAVTHFCKFYSAADLTAFFSYESVFVDPINVLFQTSVCMLTFIISNHLVTKYSCQKRKK